MTHTKVVLLACGSFNPPTNMHLRMFELARDHFNRLGHYQVIAGIISPVHDSYGKKELTPAPHRCALIKLALQDSDWIHLSNWECTQEAWTPTRKIIQYHQNKINCSINSFDGSGDKLNENDDSSWVRAVEQYHTNGVGVTVKLLCGADLLQSFGTPGLWKEHDIETIVGDHGLAVITRSGSDPLKFIYESDILTHYMNNIHIITEWITNEVSSSKIRRSLRRGESVKYLIPKSVIDYIKGQCLYGSLDNKYHMYTNSSSYNLTPSPSDFIMKVIDTPDSGNYSRPSPNREGKSPRPGIAVAVRKVTDVEVEIIEQVEEEEEEEEEDDDDEEETRVEIQITEDGRIEVISDKETTV